MATVRFPLVLRANGCRTRPHGVDWVTDPVDGHLLDYGPVVRTAPPKLHDYVVNRHVQCCFPGCNRLSSAADLDHEPPWREDGTGGHTSSADLRPLCRRHHRLKTLGRWWLDHLADGGVQVDQSVRMVLERSRRHPIFTAADRCRLGRQLRSVLFPLADGCPRRKNVKKSCTGCRFGEGCSCRR